MFIPRIEFYCIYINTIIQVNLCYIQCVYVNVVILCNDLKESKLKHRAIIQFLENFVKNRNILFLLPISFYAKTCLKNVESL